MRGSQRVSDARTFSSTRPRKAAVFGWKTRSWIPQPKPGRITRSAGAVPRMIQMLCWILSSPSANASRPSGPGLTGNDHPRPRKPAPTSATDEHRACRNDRPDWQVDGVVAGGGGVPCPRCWLAVDQHRAASGDDLTTVTGRGNERATERDVWRGVGGGAPQRGRWAAVDGHVGA